MKHESSPFCGSRKSFFPCGHEPEPDYSDSGANLQMPSRKRHTAGRWRGCAHSPATNRPARPAKRRSSPRCARADRKCLAEPFGCSGVLSTRWATEYTIPEYRSYRLASAGSSPSATGGSIRFPKILWFEKSKLLPLPYLIVPAVNCCIAPEQTFKL